MRVMVPDYLVDYFLPKLRESDPNVELVPISAEGTYPGGLEGVKVLYRFYPVSRFPRCWGGEVLREVIARAPDLRWFANGYAGVEGLLIPELVESDIILTNAAGGPRLPIAETVLMYLLIDAKSLVAHLEAQRARRWESKEHRDLQGKTVAILGLGRIGLEIARLCKAMGMRVIGTKRRAEGTLPNVDELFATSRQNECVAQADYVVAIAALTPETAGMVNAATFDAMKRDAALVNVGRGALVDEAALIAALSEGKIRAAYLDVFTQEPLPPDSPFWTMPNVVVTPHNSPRSERSLEYMTAAFVENFGRFCRGEPLENVVDKRAGY